MARRSGWRTFIVFAIAGSVLLAAGASCSEDAFVDRLTIVNRTPFDVDVRLSDAEKRGWLLVGHATHESSTVHQQVRDVGATWVFRFHHAGITVGELTVERDELTRARWRVDVPSSVADRMRRLDFEPPFHE